MILVLHNQYRDVVVEVMRGKGQNGGQRDVKETKKNEAH